MKFTCFFLRQIVSDSWSFLCIFLLSKQLLVTEGSLDAKCIVRHETIFQNQLIYEARFEFDIDAFQSLHLNLVLTVECCV